MRIAIKENGVVANIIICDQENAPANSGPANQHTYVGQKLKSTGALIDSAAPEPRECYEFDNTPGVDTWVPIDAATVKGMLLARVRRAAEAGLASLTEDYATSEGDTWPDQQREARLWTGRDGTDPATPLLDAMGMDKDEISARIIERSDVYLSACGTVLGDRVRKSDAISAAATAEEALNA